LKNDCTSFIKKTLHAYEVVSPSFPGEALCARVALSFGAESCAMVATFAAETVVGLAALILDVPGDLA
jgi:hypothetical protein